MPLLEPSVIDDPSLKPIAEKVLASERLTYKDGVTLYRSHDILTIGYLANLVRERKSGNVTYFNVNRHINPTNVCVAACKLCAFGRQVRDPKAYTMSLEEVWHTAGSGYTEAVSEFHIVGGLHPELTLDWYCEMIAGLKQRFPQVHLKAFTMVEAGYLARRSHLSIEETLRRLKQAGVDSMPGGGAALSAITKSAARNGSRRRERPTASACARTPQCSTGISKQTKTASITC